MTGYSIPQNYTEWRYCITVTCGLELTSEFIDKRITALENVSDFKTKQYIELYGSQYHQLVLSWFSKAKASQT